MKSGLRILIQVSKMPVSVRPKWEQPHKCTYSQCNKSFRQSQHLTRHLITHTGEKSHNCAQCSKSFTDAGNLKRHLPTHSGEKAHNCLQCSKSFNQAGDLKIRLLTHSGVKQHNLFFKQKLEFCPSFRRSNARIFAITKKVLSVYEPDQRSNITENGWQIHCRQNY